MNYILLLHLISVLVTNFYMYWNTVADILTAKFYILNYNKFYTVADCILGKYLKYILKKKFQNIYRQKFIYYY